MLSCRHTLATRSTPRRKLSASRKARMMSRTSVRFGGACSCGQLRRRQIARRIELLAALDLVPGDHIGRHPEQHRQVASSA